MGNDRLERRPEARAFSVETLLGHVRDGKIRIPDFQRPLRWRANHVLDLFDSVYRGFPVGDLLLFKRPADAGVIHFGPASVHAPAVPDAYFVVDGQQRITALAGAMLHPEPQPRGDIYAVWFDLEEERFVRADGEPPAHWIPLNVVGDSFALLTWLNAWPFRAQRPDLVQRAIGLGKALREYQIPAYIVEGASDEALRLIFKRVNTSGVAMLETEIFTALFGAGEPRPVESACARLQTATGFGQIPESLFLRCIKAVEELPLDKLSEEQVMQLDPSAVEATERALLQALRFLMDDAGVIRFELLPGPRSLVVLSRFFRLHPRPAHRTRELLSHWLWRSALTWMGFDRNRDALRLIGGDEFASVERLLDDAPKPTRIPSASTRWEGVEATMQQICVLALVHLGPRDPETGRALGIDDVRALLEQNSLDAVFPDVGEVFGEGDLWGATVARRVLVPSYEKIAKLAGAPLPVLESHGLDQEAADALGRGDIATFVQRRTSILDRWFERFFSARTGADDNDRPPVDELIRRVDRAFTSS